MSDDDSGVAEEREARIERAARAVLECAEPDDLFGHWRFEGKLLADPDGVADCALDELHAALAASPIPVEAEKCESPRRPRMPEIPVRPEAMEKAMGAYARTGSTKAAIAAFCEVEGLTVEARETPMFPATADIPGAFMLKEQRLVGPWRDVGEER